MDRVLELYLRLDVNNNRSIKRKSEKGCIPYSSRINPTIRAVLALKPRLKIKMI